MVNTYYILIQINKKSLVQKVLYNNVNNCIELFTVTWSSIGTY